MMRRIFYALFIKLFIATSFQKRFIDILSINVGISIGNHTVSSSIWN